MDIAALRAQFERDGFLHARGLVPEIAALAPAIDDAVARRKRLDTRTLDEKSLYEQSFIQCQYLWEDSPGVGALTFHEKICGLAAALIGAERLRLWHDQALYKEAGGRETEAHQDHPYWPIAERDTLTAWVPLVDVDEENGMMGYLPGSHRGEAHFIDIFRTPGDGKRLEAAFADTQPVWSPCKAGDVIFHHGYTAHLAKPNRSNATRRVYTAIYFKDGCTRTGKLPHPSVDRDQISDGARIGGGATPIVWPLANGRLPEPAPWPESTHPRTLAAKRLGIIPGEPA